MHQDPVYIEKTKSLYNHESGSNKSASEASKPEYIDFYSQSSYSKDLVESAKTLTEDQDVSYNASISPEPTAQTIS